MKILIADDEKPVRDAILLLVDWNEFCIDQIFQAEDGSEAISLINREHPDLVLTDIMMPVSTGLYLMEWIYRNSVPCKVIAISGYTDYEYVRQIFIQGGIDYISKPIQPQKLHNALRKAISQIEIERASAPASAEIPQAQDPNAVFYQIKCYIDECYTQNLTLGGIAAHFYLSESYLSRKFKKLFHLNVIQYIKTVRINYAKRYLIQTAVPVGEIANLVGYDDEKYFSRIFKEIEGITPNAYRQRHRFT